MQSDVTSPELVFSADECAEGSRLLAALAVRGADFGAASTQIRTVLPESFELRFIRGNSGAVERIDIVMTGDARPIRTLEQILALLEIAPQPDAAKRAAQAFRRLAEMPGVTPQALGRPETFIEVYGACLGMQQLGMERFAAPDTATAAVRALSGLVAESAPPPKDRPSAYDIPVEEWEAQCKELGVPVFRARQLREWLYVRLAPSFDAMDNLPKALRQGLSERFRGLDETARVREISGNPGETRKLLLELQDGNCIETVVIPARDRVTVCVSSQVGCAFHCAFCASGVLGLTRSLTRGEILTEVLRATELIGRRPDNLVFMGIGEPFANYAEVLGAIRTLNSPDGLAIGARHITVSTCGVVPGIRKFAQEGLQIELSVSLHAPTSEQRSQLMPVNRTYPLPDLMAAVRDYTEGTGRIVTFEYTLVRGFNDRPRDAEALVRLLRRLKCRVNLIPLSPVAEFDGERPTEDTIRGFTDFLMRHGINTTVRYSKGKASDAACGQLRLRRMGGERPKTGRMLPR